MNFTKVYRLLLLVCLHGISMMACNNHDQDISIDKLDAPIISVNLKYEIPLPENQDFFFGGISDISVLSDGRIVILDDILKNIHIFSSDGEYINSALSEGRGPGEILNPHRIIRTSKNDMVAFYDQGLQRISLFSFSESDLVHLRDIKIERIINDLHILSDENIVVYEPGPIGELRRKDQVFLIKENEEYETNPIVVFDVNEQLMLSTSVGNTSVAMGISTEYHTKNYICFLDSRMVKNRSNFVGFTIYDLDTGAILNETRYNRPVIPLPISKREEVIDGILETGLFNSGQKSQLITEMPDIYPHVNDIKCDPGNNYIWLDITTEAEKSEWVLFSDSGEILGRLDPNFNESILYINQNVIYAKTEDDKGNFSLKVYTTN